VFQYSHGGILVLEGKLASFVEDTDNYSDKEVEDFFCYCFGSVWDGVGGGGGGASAAFAPLKWWYALL
jgi:hypothetical protein